MSKLQIVYSGVGGQGLVIAGFLLGKAASIYDGKQTAMVMTYGAESRGTFTKADVTVSDQSIDFPEIIVPDVVIALAQVAFDRYASVLGENSTIIYDSDVVTPTDSKATLKGYPISETAKNAGGQLSANMVATGILLQLTKAVSPESFLETMKAHFKSKGAIAEKNALSFQKGLEVAG